MNPVADSFFQVEHARCETSEGSIELPIAYYDTHQLIALFEAEPERVRALLGERPLELVTLGGKARIALVFFEYKATSIGPYNEVGLATLCVPKGERPPRFGALDVLRDPRKRRVGFHVLHLPVTTAAANAAGRELWGYPKFVTSISVELGAKHFTGVVRDPELPEQSIVKLEGKLPLSVPIPAVQLMLLSVLDHTLLRAVVDVRGKHLGGPGGSLQLNVGSSSHAMAQTLRSLALDGARAELAVYARHARSLLHAGMPVATA